MVGTMKSLSPMTTMAAVVVTTAATMWSGAEAFQMPLTTRASLSTLSAATMDPVTQDIASVDGVQTSSAVSTPKAPSRKTLDVRINGEWFDLTGK